MTNNIQIKLKYALLMIISLANECLSPAENPVKEITAEEKMLELIQRKTPLKDSDFCSLRSIIDKKPDSRVDLVKICNRDRLRFLRLLEIFNSFTRELSNMTDHIPHMFLSKCATLFTKDCKKIVPETLWQLLFDCFYFPNELNKFGLTRFALVLITVLPDNHTQKLFKKNSKNILIDNGWPIGPDLSMMLCGADGIKKMCKDLYVVPAELMFMFLGHDRKSTRKLARLVANNFNAFESFFFGLSTMESDSKDMTKIDEECASKDGLIPQFKAMLASNNGPKDALANAILYSTNAPDYLMLLFLGAANDQKSLGDGAWMQYDKHRELKSDEGRIFFQKLEDLEHRFGEDSSKTIGLLKQMWDNFKTGAIESVLPDTATSQEPSGATSSGNHRIGRLAEEMDLDGQMDAFVIPSEWSAATGSDGESWGSYEALDSQGASGSSSSWGQNSGWATGNVQSAASHPDETEQFYGSQIHPMTQGLFNQSVECHPASHQFTAQRQPQFQGQFDRLREQYQAMGGIYPLGQTQPISAVTTRGFRYTDEYGFSCAAFGLQVPRGMWFSHVAPVDSGENGCFLVHFVLEEQEQQYQ